MSDIPKKENHFRKESVHMKTLIILLAGSLFMGCAVTQTDTLQHVKNGTDSINKIADAITALMEADPASNKEVVNSFKNELATFKEKQNAKNKDMQEKYDKEIADKNAFFAGLMELAFDAIPAGNSANNLVNVFGTLFNKTRNEAVAESKVVLTKEIDATNSMITKEIKTVNDNVKKVSTKIGALDKKFAGLSTELKEKLASVHPDVIEELKTLKDKGEAFRDKLQFAAGLTEEKMKELEGFSTEEILMLLALVGGTASGAGGVLARTGKSRSAVKVAELEIKLDNLDKFAKLEAKLNRIENPSANA